MNEHKIVLDKTNYPLVVGNRDKLLFEDWEISGSTVLLHATILTDEYEETDVIWSVENTEVVSIVSAQGTQCEVRGRTIGYTSVTAALPDGSKAECAVVVIDNITRTTASTIRLNTDRLFLRSGRQTQLYPYILPVDVWADAESGFDHSRKAKTMNTDIVWISDNDNIVQVTSEGILTAKEAGETDVIAITKDVGRRAVCHVTVAEDMDEMPVEYRGDVRLEMLEGDHLTLPVTGSFFTYCSENPYVAEIDPTGEITAYANSNREHVSEDGFEVTDVPGTIEVRATAIYGGDSKVFYLSVASRPRKRNVIDLPETPLQTTEERGWSEQRENAYLQQLHIPQETVTDHSVTLLWKRESMIHAKQLDSYRIIRDGEEIARIRELSYTAKCLEPDRKYVFTVEAIGHRGELLADARITAFTKKTGITLNVLEAPYRAKGDDTTMDTLAIQAAIDACPEGGTVWLPEGHVYRCGALFLKSNMTFLVDGILLGSTHPKDYPFVISRWEGWQRRPQTKEEWKNSTPNQPYNTYVRASLLNLGEYEEGSLGEEASYNAENVVICGNGQINGNGFRLAYNEGCNQYDGNGGRPVPFCPVMNQTMRGSILRIHNARNVFVTDLTFAYGPGWQIHPIFCRNVTFDHVAVISKGNGLTGAADNIGILNGDGIDPDSCMHVNILNSYFYCNDDSVTLKSGRNREGNELARPDAYIRVTDCISDKSKAGFVMGSELASGCHDVLMQNLKVRDAVICGLWLKTMRARGGNSYRLKWRDIIIEGCEIPIRIASEYGAMSSSAANTNPAENPPDIGELEMENIDGTRRNKNGIQFIGLSDAPIHDVRLEQVRFGMPRDAHSFQNCIDFEFLNCDKEIFANEDMGL